MKVETDRCVLKGRVHTQMKILLLFTYLELYESFVWGKDWNLPHYLHFLLLLQISNLIHILTYIQIQYGVLKHIIPVMIIVICYILTWDWS